ncbi:MAG TPA: sulfatase-like hydrolase/transferase [Acidobacteriota bacterium]|jgi:hypothetical protein|nr:sulfatase-like hydrolase/transferase [Acidobacteriota bacterium]HQQ47921.1 sulfatase-like hydrolase/transferase [Acidobacteriota bacterium]
MTKRLFQLLMMVALILPEASGRGSETAPPASNVIVVTIDTWRWDAIGKSGSAKVATPILDRIAENGVYCKKAWTAAGMTTPSHASIFTGTYPQHHGIRDNHGFRLSAKVKTLAELLEERGYDTAAFVSAFPLARGSGIERGFRVYDDSLPASGSSTSLAPRERKGDATLGAVLKWLEKPPEKFFLWVHFYDPHFKYEPPPGFSKRYENPYFGEVAFVDSLLGKLRAAAGALKGGDKALWVVCGDHGEALGGHGEDTHGIFVYDETSRVPLIFSGAGVRTSEIQNARLIDVMPTILDILGIPVPKEVDGGSLLEPRRGPFRAYTETMSSFLNFGAAPVRAFSDGRFKVIDVPRREVYDLAGDPGESVNLFGHPSAEPAGVLFRELSEAVGESLPPSKGARTTPEEERALSSLGYIGAGGGIRVHNLMDPKDFVHRHKKISSAAALFEKREYSRAALLYEELLKEFPKSPRLLGQLGLCRLFTGDPAGGEARLREALKIDPDSGLVLVALGNISLARGDGRAAEGFYLRALDADPDNVEANLNLGILYHSSPSSRKKAVAYFRKFLELVPDDPEAQKVKGYLR